MHDEPAESPSGLQQELAAESQASLPAPKLRLLAVGIGLAWVGILLAAFYAYMAPAAEPLAYRAVLNAGVVLLGAGLIALVLGLAHFLRPQGRPR